MSGVEWQILEIRKDGDTDAFKQYVWDINYVDAPVCRWRDENTDGSDIEELYYTYDANFNVTALIHPQYGYRMDRFIYDAYGNVTVLDAGWSDDADQVSDVDNDVLYCGYRYDAETGLYQDWKNPPFVPFHYRLFY